MKTIKSITLAFFMLVSSYAVSYAQANHHSHKAAHGGLVQEADGYHIEMVKTNESISFYVLDAKLKTVANKSITGKAVFDFFNNTKTSSTLAKYKKDALWVSTPKANVFTYCTVSFIIQGKTISSKFKNDAVSQEDINHGHQH
jgi:hypothetical protein